MVKTMNLTIQQARTGIINLLKSVITKTTDIRELSWQGDSGAYPCVRYSVDCEPDECGNYVATLTVYCWSEGNSSLEAEQVRDEIVNGILGHSVSTPVKIQVRSLTGVPSPTRDDRLWRTEAYFRCLITS